MAIVKKSTNLSTNYQQTNAVYKSNQLIESSYSLTTAQNRLIYLAMAQLKEIILDKNMNIEQVEEAIQNTSFPMIYIDVVDYKRIFKIKSNSLYKDLVKIAKDLYEEEILYINEQGNIGSKRWVITCEYDDIHKGVAMEFHPRLIRDLLVFKSEFTRMIFDEFADKLKGKHSFRIYELCKQYHKIGRRDFFIEDLRFKLKLKDNEYTGYNSLKNQVLKTSIKEINANTDLELVLEEIQKNKKTRKVEKIRFYIKTKNKPKQLNMFEDELAITRLEEDKGIVEKLSQIVGQEVSAETAQTILTGSLKVIDDKKIKLGVIDFIKEKVEVCDDYTRSTNEPIKNYIGLLLKAIRKNWKKNEIINASKFNNFEAREYDYDDLERKLLGWDD